MKRIETSLYDIAQRFVGIKEVPGPTSNPAILAMLKLDGDWPHDDAVPWCSAFVNYCAWLLRLPRSKSLRARSWLTVGVPVSIENCAPGFDVVILKRGSDSPGAEVLDAPGHVGIYAMHDSARIWLLGGNQGDTVSISPFPRASFLGARRVI